LTDHYGTAFSTKRAELIGIGFRQEFPGNYMGHLQRYYDLNMSFSNMSLYSNIENVYFQTLRMFVSMSEYNFPGILANSYTLKLYLTCTEIFVGDRNMSFPDTVD
jgi:hypothetical protein